MILAANKILSLSKEFEFQYNINTMNKKIKNVKELNIIYSHQ